MGALHFHLRRAWPCKDEETGLTTTDQTKALLKAGILPLDPKKNIDVLEEISKWDELMPSIQNFREWTKERCKDAQRTYRDEQLDPIVDMFVAAFANSNKAIKDGYDSQIKDYDHQLNGYTKETMNGKKRFFGLQRCKRMDAEKPIVQGV